MSNNATNTLNLQAAQQRVVEFRAKMSEYMGTAPADTPQSILIPIEDLEAIVTTFREPPFSSEFKITGARLYLTFFDNDNKHISGFLVPVGERLQEGITHFSEDIILDAETGQPVGPVITPLVSITAYDFTHPCPPIGNCQGRSALFTGNEVNNI